MLPAGRRGETSRSVLAELIVDLDSGNACPQNAANTTRANVILKLPIPIIPHGVSGKGV